MHKVGAGIVRILGVVIICLLTMIAAIGTYQIVTRHFFNHPGTVSEELLTYSSIWMALLVSAYVSGKRDHMRMGFLADEIISPARECLEIVIDPLTFAFAGIVTVYGDISIIKLTTIQTTASLRAPMGCIYVIASVIGLFIIPLNLMNAANMMHRDFSGKEEA